MTDNMEKTRNGLDYLFKPASIAVVGASNKADSVGWAIFRNLKIDYPGKLYAVNPKRRRVQGSKSYKTISRIGKQVDLAIVATPAETVTDIMQDCVSAGVKSVIIVSSGFHGQSDNEKNRRQEIIDIARKNKIRLLGPNCLGYINPSRRINASFTKTPARPGSIAFISQSGALGTAILDWAQNKKIGFRFFVSLGDMTDVEFTETIAYAADDPGVSSIVIYMESLEKSDKFLETVKAVSGKMPIVVLKAGITAEGAGAALSHTGRLAGSETAFEAAFRRAGVLRVDSISDMFDMVQALSMKIVPGSGKLAVITNAGGPGVIATDAIVSNGSQLAQFTLKTRETLDRYLPSNVSTNNPVDILGDAGVNRFRVVLDAVMADANTGGAVVIVTPQMMTDVREISKLLVKITEKNKKPVLTCLMGGLSIRLPVRILEKAGIQNFRNPEAAVRVYLKLRNYYGKRKSGRKKLTYHGGEEKMEKKKALRVIMEAYRNKQNTLNEFDSKKILRCYRIPVPACRIVKTADEAAREAGKIGFPVMMKILSPDILHKTEVGGYQANVASEDMAKEVYRLILKSVKRKAPKARIDGVIVEKMIRKKFELFIGSRKDPVFGPVVVFGSGGVVVELTGDTAADLAPLNMEQAYELVKKTKISKLLAGYRNLPGIDLENLCRILWRFSRLVCDLRQIKEIDINPLAVDDKGAVALDAKVVLDPNLG